MKLLQQPNLYKYYKSSKDIQACEASRAEDKDQILSRIDDIQASKGIRNKTAPNTKEGMDGNGAFRYCKLHSMTVAQ
jgi:hypothetical protein